MENEKERKLRQFEWALDKALKSVRGLKSSSGEEYAQGYTDALHKIKAAIKEANIEDIEDNGTRVSVTIRRVWEYYDNTLEFWIKEDFMRDKGEIRTIGIEQSKGGAANEEERKEIGDVAHEASLRMMAIRKELETEARLRKPN